MASKKKSTQKRVPAHIDPLTGDFVAAHLVLRGVRQMERPVRAMLVEWLVKQAIDLVNEADNYADQLDARLNFPKHYLPASWKASRREK
jgi:hypothetical protein